MTDWHEDDSFWRDCAAVMFNRQCLERTPVEVDHLLELTGLSPPARVLDMGCGPGRHALELARRGYHVTGVDRTAAYLEQARGEAEAHRLEVQWVCADMRDFRREKAFDLALSLFTTFGYFRDAAEDRRVAGNLWSCLKPGGQLVMELLGKEILARVFQKRDWREEDGGLLFLEERRLEDDWTRIDTRWILIRDGRRVEHQVSLRLYGAAELKGLLGDVGFADICAFGSLAGVPYDESAERLVIHARRPLESL